MSMKFLYGTDNVNPFEMWTNLQKTKNLLDNSVFWLAKTHSFAASMRIHEKERMNSS
jgi:hypothetical protein